MKTRIQRHGIVVACIVGAIALIFWIGFGFGQRWGANQWGPMAAWVGGATTFAAVVVALREATRGRRDRLIDYELDRRRERIKALGDLWGSIMQVGLETHSLCDYLLNLPEAFDPNVPRTDTVPQDHPGDPLCYEFGGRIQRFLDRWVTAVEPQIFMALALLADSPLKAGVNDVIRDLRRINNEVLPEINRVFCLGRRPDHEPLNAAWTALAERRQGHLDLVHQHFSLVLTDVEKALRR